MDYFKHYERLITRAKNRKLKGYIEKHHIIPKCIGGNNYSDKTNLVELTAEEHYVAHQLLVKMFPDESALIYACHRMTHFSEKYHHKDRSNNKYYSWLRKKHSKVVSKSAKSRTGKKNGSYGSSWWHNPKTLEKGRFKPEDIPAGWVKGRTANTKNIHKKCQRCSKEIYVSQKTKYCNDCRKESSIERNIQNASYYGREKELEELIKNGHSLSLALNEMGYSFSNTKSGVGKWAKQVKENIAR